MPLVYNEYYKGKSGLTLGLNRLLFSEQSPYQLVEVYETDAWGNLMTIDGMVMLSEKDEFVYHEMLSHPVMFMHPKPENICIIGGGDGGTAREVLKHKSVQSVDMVEIDETVVRASKQFLPEVGQWDDPRLNVRFEDGIEFLKQSEAAYDVIIIDGSDPVGPAEGLFEKDFYEYCRNALKENGAVSAQTESPWVEDYHPSIRKVFKVMDDVFDARAMYLAYIPLYPAGMWSFMLAGKGIDIHSESVTERINEGMKDFGKSLRYYNAEVHKGSFALPNFVAEIVE